MNRTVERLDRVRLAESIASLNSRTVEETAERGTRRGLEGSVAARARAREVLPLPGGPQRMMEGRNLSEGERRREVGPRRWSWPRIESRVAGRIRSERGAKCGRLGEGEGVLSSRLDRLIEVEGEGDGEGEGEGLKWEWQEKKRERVDWEWGVAEVEGEGKGEGQGEGGVEEEAGLERIQSAAASAERPPVAARALEARSREKPMLSSCSMAPKIEKRPKECLLFFASEIEL